jgi:uncharacterized protein (UPF0333 family)
VVQWSVGGVLKFFQDRVYFQGDIVMFTKSKQTNKKACSGQGMTEYIIVVAVIAIAAIGAFGYFGRVVETQIAGVSQELGGVDATTTRSAAGTVAGEAATNAAAANNTMGQYTDNFSGEGGGNNNNP